MENNIQRISCRSSNIQEFGYDEDSRTLQIKFKNGGLYNYSPITLQSYLSFLRSPSKGKFFFKNIKNNKLINSKKYK